MAWRSPQDRWTLSAMDIGKQDKRGETGDEGRPISLIGIPVPAEALRPLQDRWTLFAMDIGKEAKEGDRSPGEGDRCPSSYDFLGPRLDVSCEERVPHFISLNVLIKQF